MDVEKLWEALKLQCCSTNPNDKNWDKVTTIVQISKDDLKKALERLK